MGDHPSYATPISPRLSARGAGGGHGSSGFADDPTGSQVFTLRQSGARPVTFTGRHLGQHNGYRLGTPFWHELNLYQTADGRFVADIRVFFKAQGSKDQFHVTIVDSLEEALQVFEGYDARQDVSAEFDLEDAALVPAELMVQAAALRYRIADAQSQYSAVLGTFLAQLNQG
ncbi:hypothetical protein CKO45_17665 [Paracraurococcus ruber]|uniref:Uncharacterized protein n=1 Tax=Paracraurococcus ruber TaxID=77675 RepID=A0ABS1D0H9_9PROT|nr:hypothetical protein [Paracraurococcus ruber]